jgi:hypothetical protein
LTHEFALLSVCGVAVLSPGFSLIRVWRVRPLAASINPWPPGTDERIMTSRMCSRAYIVNKWGRDRGIRHVLLKSLFRSKIKFVKS